MCGENEVGTKVTADLEGSSPRVRGKLDVPPACLEPARLIPACAGKTVHLTTYPKFATAHPRVCGENGLQLQNLPRAGGSSPRVRGKLSGVPNATDHIRLIPACAGKT